MVKRKNSNFIITQDTKTKNELLNTGLTLLNDNDGVFIFLNCVEKMSKFDFSTDFKFTYSDNLTF